MKDKIVRKHETQSRADVFLSGEVGLDFTAKQLTTQLEEVGDVDELHVYIDSPGGNFGQGIEAYMALTIHPAFVTTHAQGHASSMASIILLAGDERFISANSWVMLHAVTGGAGIQEANQRMIGIYTSNTELSKPDLIEMLDSGDSWLDSGAACDAGFTDHLTPPVPFHNEASYLKHRTNQNYFASKYESFSGAKDRRKTQLLKNQAAYASNKAAILRDQLELCDQHGITHQEFNLIMNQED